MPDPVDLPAIRAEGRRLREAIGAGGPPALDAFEEFMLHNCDALLADPTPGDRLTEAERREMQLARARFTNSTDSEDLADSISSLMSIIDRLSGSGEQPDG